MPSGSIDAAVTDPFFMALLLVQQRTIKMLLAEVRARKGEAEGDPDSSFSNGSLEG